MAQMLGEGGVSGTPGRYAVKNATVAVDQEPGLVMEGLIVRAVTLRLNSATLFSVLVSETNALTVNMLCVRYTRAKSQSGPTQN